ncbi:hypothetical protein [Mycoplasma phage sp.]|uniref:Uncharacterized protein n=1 Tax=Mycoplasma anserisalpingitidis TaxID=519450 RepID=A0A8F2DEZ0_9MOLU|nr:hypothetical protein [Mycoplasma phage sp.]QRI44092.1 hypothetical protein [Mycoplasma phage sp.]QWS78875.1 hypothetical protein [Mycoplasma anserisalpingitidis]
MTRKNLKKLEIRIVENTPIKKITYEEMKEYQEKHNKENWDIICEVMRKLSEM